MQFSAESSGSCKTFLFTLCDGKYFMTSVESKKKTNIMEGGFSNNGFADRGQEVRFFARKFEWPLRKYLEKKIRWNFYIDVNCKFWERFSHGNRR